MSKTLFLFLFSPYPDGYINAISYAYEHLDVKKVKLIHLKGVKTDISDEDATYISNRIWSQLENLSRGDYVFFPRDLNIPQDKLSRKRLTGGARSDIYRRILQGFVNDGITDVNYDKLRSELLTVFKKYGGTNPKDYIVDLTPGPKAPSVDIFMSCLALNVDQIYLFELIDAPNRDNPDESLYHALLPEQFRYTCITKSPAVIAGRAAFLRKGRIRWIVMLVAFLILLSSSLILIFSPQASDNSVIQVISLLSGIVGLLTPLFSLVSERQS